MFMLSGLRNTNSQIAASFTSDGKYVISASEDSQVFVWKREEPRNTGTGKRTVMNSRGHENFPCKDVSVAIPWPGTVKGEPQSKSIANSKRQSKRSQPQQTNTTSCDSPTNEDNPAINTNNKKGLPPLPKKNNNNNNIERSVTPPEEDVVQISSTDTGNIGESSPSPSVSRSSSLRQGDNSPSISAASNLNSSSSIRAGDSPSISSASNSIRYGDSPSVSSATTSSSWGTSWSWFDVGGHGNQPTEATAWGLVIVTATLGGEIKIYQNFGMPRKIGRL